MSRRLQNWQVVVAAAVLAGLTAAAAAAPAAQLQADAATRPASTTPTSAPVDPTTPKGALKSLAQALEAGDRALVLELLDASTPGEQKIATATADLAEATAVLRRAATKAFGETAARPLGVDPGATNEAMARVDASNVALDSAGAKATVRSPDADEPPLTMVLREAKWRVPVSEISKDVEAADLDKNLKDVAEQGKLLKELAGEVSAGKYKTAAEARQELDKRIMKSAMPQLEPTTTTTTSAPTKPATRP
jgi:hypothetical protein